jgi:hypothetical protein
VGSLFRTNKKRRSKMATNRGNKPEDARRRRVRSDGLIEEWYAGMGWVTTIPADPQPRKLNISADAPGWERLWTLRWRLRR